MNKSVKTCAAFVISVCCSIAAGQTHGSPGPAGPGDGGLSDGGAVAGSQSNWWKLSDGVEQMSRTITVSRGFYSWEGTSTADLAGTYELPWEDPSEGWFEDPDSNPNNSNETGYDDDTSRGEIEYLTSSAYGRCVARVEAEVDDSWNYGVTHLSLLCETEFQKTMSWYWDGDDDNPAKPTEFQKNAHLKINLDVQGNVEHSSIGSSNASATFTADYQVGDPFNFQERFSNIGIRGTAEGAGSQPGQVDWIGIGLGMKILGVLINFEQMENLDSSPHHYHGSFLHAGNSLQKQWVTAGVTYSLSAAAKSTSAVYSNGGTAAANALSRLDADLNVGPLPVAAEHHSTLGF